VIAVSGRYEQILNYVVSADWIFFGLSASCLFVLRRRDARGAATSAAGYSVPGHPWTTAAFVVVSALIVANTLYKYPANSLIGLAIMLAGVPVYLIWSGRGSARR
jgi:APA family basic amino acid/polyamine antiporter